MLCPHCGKEMEKGGMIAKADMVAIPVHLVWYPMDEYEKKGLEASSRVRGKKLDEDKLLPGSVRIDDVYYCERCNRVIADMPVVSDEVKMPQPVGEQAENAD